MYTKGTSVFRIQTIFVSQSTQDQEWVNIVFLGNTNIFKMVGCFEDLHRFFDISDLSRLGNRRSNQSLIWQ